MNLAHIRTLSVCRLLQHTERIGSAFLQMWICEQGAAEGQIVLDECRGRRILGKIESLRESIYIRSWLQSIFLKNQEI